MANKINEDYLEKTGWVKIGDDAWLPEELVGRSSPMTLNEALAFINILSETELNKGDVHD